VPLMFRKVFQCIWQLLNLGFLELIELTGFVPLMFGKVF
jgi:hypothetical protein